MALASKIKTLVEQAIEKLDDLRSYVTYVRVVPGAYNPATDALTNTTTSYTNTPCVLLKLTTEDLDWWPGDLKGQKMLLASNDLVGVIPDDTDHVIIDSLQWNIYKVKRVPGDSLFIIYLREP